MLADRIDRDGISTDAGSGRMNYSLSASPQGGSHIHATISKNGQKPTTEIPEAI
ncbi:hypothetical protein SBA1_1470018 [Candidatus Sulfotelmatobacter kueseliae]|uniref:Uncharacterized protein n=1 Tax=Candidatus Sulfotelmatobacter kueseliae TaxID=2042962 RepID=A0A2U3K8B0_9BACT|nr:hypothetical protein SBA1_1470018 [Candidatus Sulfotelmatobacter kueseliae]